MDEREMLKKIAESAQNLEAPDALKPKQVQKQLRNSSQNRKKGKWHWTLAAAACLCLCFGAAGITYQNHAGSRIQTGLDDSGTNLQTDTDDPGSSIRDTEMETQEEKTGEDLKEEPPLKKIGKMYTLASGYGEVYDVLKESDAERYNWKADQKQMLSAEREDTGMIYAAAENSVMDAAGSLSAGDVQERSAEDSTEEFSTTNLQVEGVDESDIVKTDGRYIYVVQNSRIRVLDISGKVPKKAAVIEPEMDEDADRICEMYVDDNRLTVILQMERTTLKQREKSATELKNGEVIIENEGQLDNMNQTDKMPEDAVGRGSVQDMSRELDDEDIQYIDTSVVTKAVSYDITDPERPVLQDTAEQDGWYQTSRKIKDRLYLFTNEGLAVAEGISRKNALGEDELKLWLPCVNGKAVSADCIYLPKKGNAGLLMTSIDLADHHKVLDTKLLINEYAQLYVSSNSVYLYYNDYTNEAVKTRIAKFVLEADGRIRAKAASTLKGSIEDTFAIHEQDGYLQVLTSVMSSDPWENRVYVLDEDMKTAGKLAGLAKGERIYAARFIGKTGYFVTYRNTDPLFTVDFSDPAAPKVIGELEVSGFSEYLHFWSDDRLLGIGLETNPDSGETIGVKLSMFDISNPAKVKEEAKVVLEGTENSEALHDYKSVLADLRKNMIVLVTESYHEKYKEDFRVFSYIDGQFVSRVARPLAAGNKEYEDSRWRSLFVGDMLYLVSEKKAIAFDMKQGWKETGKLVYVK